MIFATNSITHGVNTIKALVKTMPKKPGIYKMISKKGDVLYVGKAKNLPKRVVSYANIERLPNRLRRMVALLDKIEFEVTNTEAEALLLEAGLIRSIKPPFNIMLRDDKSFPYIWIDRSKTYPRITKFRGTPKNQKDYWGPFASAGAVSETIVEIQKIFNIRPCSDSFFESRKRPCLEYQIHRCSAPCVSKINPQDYGKSITSAVDFLNGKSNEIHEHLQQQMWLFSENKEYEKAAKIRDKIAILNQIQNKNIFHSQGILDADIISIVKHDEVVCIQVLMVRNRQNFGSKTFFPTQVEGLDLPEILHDFIMLFYQGHMPQNEVISNIAPININILADALLQLHKKSIKFLIPKRGAKKDIVDFVTNNAKNSLLTKLSRSKNMRSNLKAVAALFELQHEVKRIEIYDNSHTSGKDAVGAYVVMKEDGFDRNQYRRFNIKRVQPKAGGDDYSMLRETLMRRIKRLEEGNYPDIMLIDGGKGHLAAAHQVLAENGVDDILLVCISKGVNRNAGREFLHIKGRDSFQLPIGDKVLRFLQMMRDEVHNYAISKHRKMRAKSFITSKLDDIEGIGGMRKLKLLQHFGSPSKVAEASVEDIERVPGISKKIAENIYNHLHLDADNE